MTPGIMYAGLAVPAKATSKIIVNNTAKLLPLRIQ